MSEKNLATHLTVFKQFLEISAERGQNKAKAFQRAAKAREKLLKLSDSQFKELSTDVYDELRRRIDESRGQPEYLLPKLTFHPNRNKARQKLSTLAQHRFKDLVSDISYEIERRKLQEEPAVVEEVPEHQSPEKELLVSRNESLSTRTIESQPETSHDANVSKSSSDIPNQTIGISNKTVVPTKANLTWSSDEEEDEDKEVNLNDEPKQDQDDLNSAKQLGGLNGSFGKAIGVAGAGAAVAGASRGIGEASLDNDSNDTVVDSELARKLQEKEEQHNQLQLDLEKLQKEHDEVLDKNFALTKQISDFDNERTQWNQLKAEYDQNIRKLQDRSEYDDLMKDYEQLKSANAALRLENQSLKNSVSRDHTRTNSMNTLSRDFSTNAAAAGIGAAAGAGAVAATSSDKSASNLQMNMILEKLSSLDAPAVAQKNQSFTQLQEDVSKWQKRYEDLKTDKLTKLFNNDLLSLGNLKSLISSSGKIPLALVTRFHSQIETFLTYLEDKNHNSDVLFDKVSSLSLTANEIANRGDNSQFAFNDLSTQVRDSTSHLLTVTRYYTVYSSLLPSVVVEKAVNGLVFSVCELVGKHKVSNGDYEPETSRSLPVPQTKAVPETKDNDESIGVRPLRMANKLKNNSDDSFHSRDVSPKNQPRKFNALASRLERLTDSLNTLNNASNDTSQVNISKSVIPNDQEQSKNPETKQLESSFDEASVKTTPTKKNVLDKIKQFESPPPEPSKKRSSFSPPGSDHESTSNSFLLNRSLLEMKKSLKDRVQKFNYKDRELPDADISASSIKSTSSNIGAPVAAAAFGVAAGAAGIAGASAQSDKADTSASQVEADLPAAARSNSKGKSIFQSIRDRFTDTSNGDIEEEGDVNTNSKSIQKGTTDTKEIKLDDVSEVKDTSTQDLSSDNVQTSTAETTPSRDGNSDLEISPNKSFQSVRSRLAQDAKERVPSSSASDVTIKPEEPEVQASAAKNIKSSAPSEKKKVMIELPKNSSNGDDEKTAKARQRQEYRKSMAAASFNVDLFDIEDPDNTLTQVLLYLEHQTVEVINTIQLLLSAIRKPNSTRGELSGKSRAVVEVIQQMTEATNVSMNQTRNAQLKEHGSWIVKSLEDCYHRMNILTKPSSDEKKEQEFADKSLKQRLAGSCHDIVRCTKELVKTVEEASLKEDIANLDARLRHADDLT